MADESLAAQAGALATQLKMPAIFNQPQEKLIDRFIAPYVVYAHPKRASEWQKIIAKYPGDQEGSPFLIEQSNITKLSTFKASILKASQYWAAATPDGKITGASFEQRPSPFKEHIECVILMYLEDRVLPANVSVRTTKCPAYKLLSDKLIEAGKPEWADNGASYKETLALPQAFMRFYGEVGLGDKQISKSSGLPYKPTTCTIFPSGIAEIRQLQEFVNDENAQKMLNDAAERMQFRMAEIKQYAAKTPA